MNKLCTGCIAATMTALVISMPSESLARESSGMATARTASVASIQIDGAGATFPYRIYSRWFEAYEQRHPEVKINYQAIGSGGGIRQFTAGNVFFGATDGPMTDEQLQSARGRVLHFPTVVGGLVPIYNVPGVTSQIRFTGRLLADIYLGKITKWNDEAITTMNPDVNLPGTGIVVVHRNNGSVTTYTWCDFLSKTSRNFKRTIGLVTSVKWPVGIGAKGAESVSSQVLRTPGSIGYVELTEALENEVRFASVQNMSGEFISATHESITAAAAAAAAVMPDDFRVSIANAEGKDSYPISFFTWLLLYEKPQDKQRARVMVGFLKWALSDGQKLAPGLGYAPLPPAVIEKELKSLDKVQVQL